MYILKCIYLELLPFFEEFVIGLSKGLSVFINEINLFIPSETSEYILHRMNFSELV